MSQHDEPRAISPWRTQFLVEHKLPDAYLETARRFFDPLAALLANDVHRPGVAVLVGLNGSQGSGKSTLCDYLCEALRNDHDLKAVALSLDDFYLTRAERQALASDVHPLLATRGVPGTHDIDLLRQTLHALRTSEGNAQGNAKESAKESAKGDVAVPRFDKAVDDRAAPEHWTRVEAPVDIVLLEGWCLGARSEDTAQLQVPTNALERDEDADGAWRGYINRALRDAYESLYDDIDFWLMLAAPGFEHVLSWRSEQEAKLRSKRADAGKGLMNDQQLRRFVAHFERHTKQCMEHLPQTVDVLYRLDESRRIVSVRGPDGLS
ncbi:MAG: hypothetical protein AB8B57_17220 [Congregibacter sp.]